MRFSTLVTSVLCFSTALGGTLHQHVVKRSTSDIWCVFTLLYCVLYGLLMMQRVYSVSLDLNLDMLNHIFGHLNSCVCLSTLDNFIDENPTCKAASRKFGRNKLRE